jgi:hypothetical protein
MSETPKPGMEVLKPQYFRQTMRNIILGNLATQEIVESVMQPQGELTDESTRAQDPNGN